jgi:sulfate/thiosulfate-binding protein
MSILLRTLTAVLLAGLLIACSGCEQGPAEAGADSILNVSYDTTRELFRELNAAFVKHWREETGRAVEIRQSHAASGTQARAVIAGLQADTVNLVVPYDIDVISRTTGEISADWRSKFPFNSSPFTSTIVFLVRKGNPKGVSDWADLVREGVSVIAPNPKTSGGARWIYLAAWGYALRESGGDEAAARRFVSLLYANTPVLDKASRAATLSFVRRGFGDVLLAWENEAHLAITEIGEDKLEIVVPPVSILAEPSVAVVDAVVDRRGSRRLAEAYLAWLFEREAQEIAARNNFRPRDPEVLAAFSDKFHELVVFSVEEIAGSWEQAQKKHFEDGGIFDQIYKPGQEQ